MEGGDGITTPVLLNIYDMYWTNQYTSMLGVGIFHTGIQVYDTEYAFGGHPFDFSGIFEITPKEADDLGDHYKYKETILLGQTSFTREEIRQAVNHLGRDFRGSSYHLMTKNCNHFSAELCQLLCGQELPAWVNRLAYVSTCIPFLEKCVPKDWVTPSALEMEVSAQTHSAPTGGRGGGGREREGSSSSSTGLLSFLDMLKSGTTSASTLIRKSSQDSPTPTSPSPSSGSRDGLLPQRANHF